MLKRTASALLVTLLLASSLWGEPGLYSPHAYRGETFQRVMEWRVVGVLVNLAGYAAKIQVRDTVSNSIVDEFAVGTGLALGGALGTITWDMTAAETLALPVGNLAYDLRLTSGGGQVIYLLYGYVNVHETRTR